MVETVTDAQLKQNIDKLFKGLGGVEDFIADLRSGAKRDLMQKWSQDYHLTTLELQRVLRIVEEFGGRK